MKGEVIIRTLQFDDNIHIARVIRSVLEDMGVPKVGSAYEDKSLDDMYQCYQQARSTYYIIEEDGRILGGAGIAPLANYKDDSVAELQKMYFLNEARGRGLGSLMIERCLEQARKFDYKQVYLETMPYMTAARKLYERVGFSYIDKPMGNTGHYSCPIWMCKSLV